MNEAVKMLRSVAQKVCIKAPFSSAALYVYTLQIRVKKAPVLYQLW